MNHKRCLVKLNFVGGASWQFIVLGCLCVWFLSCNKIITDFISVYKDILVICMCLLYFVSAFYLFVLQKQKDSRSEERRVGKECR